MNDDTVFTLTELCRRWKCDRHGILGAIHAGKLRAFRLGKRTYRVSAAEVVRYELAEQAA